MIKAADPPPADASADAARLRRQVVCGGALIAIAVYRLVLLFATPSLIGSDPVLLELLRGSTPSLVAGGAFARVGRASLVLALVAPLVTLMIGDPFVWWAGRLWGPDLIELVLGQGARQRRGVRIAMQLVERGRSVAIIVAPVVPVGFIIYAAAGWTGMRLWRFLLLDVIGTMAWIGLIVGLGYALGRPAVHVAHAITRDSLLITIGLVVVSVAIAVWRSARAPRPDDPDDSAVQ